MNKFVESAKMRIREAGPAPSITDQAKKLLQEAGVNPGLLDVAITEAKKQETEELRTWLDAYREENMILENELEDMHRGLMTLVDSKREFLERIVNIDVKSEKFKENFKHLQNVASREVGTLEIIGLISKK